MVYKIRIIRNSACGNWYENKIGNIYIVEDWNDCWKTIKNGYLIGKMDAEVIKEIELGKRHRLPRLT